MSERDVQDEIDFHLAKQASDLEAAGWSPEKSGRAS